MGRSRSVIPGSAASTAALTSPRVRAKVTETGGPAIPTV